MTAAPSTGVVPATAWVTERFGVRLLDAGGHEPAHSLVQLGLRRNPRRAHLLVSGLLGKHIPADPHAVHDAGVRLARLVAPHVRGAVCVLGYAETATGLGHVVAETLGAYYLHSTRRSVSGTAAFVTFDEEHSHAVAHRLLPEESEHLTIADTVVLVDDELSTGRTAMNTMSALHERGVRADYVIATLVDVRSGEDDDRLRARARSMGVRLQVVSLSAAELSLPEGIGDAVLQLAEPDNEAVTAPSVATPSVAPPPASTTRWPAAVRAGGRHGFGPADAAAAGAAARDVAAQLADHVLGEEIAVLGTEELMYTPLLVARALADRVAGRARVVFSSTTRSPVVTVDEPGYPVRTRLTFDAPDAAGEKRFAYNVAPPKDCAPFSDIVVVVDDEADTAALRAPGGLLTAVGGVTERVHLVIVGARRARPAPLRGPDFGSYRAADVGWLLTDLSAAELERPTQEREYAIQAGRAHYSESLPVEYQPSAEYVDLFGRCLHENAAQVAEAVGVLTEIVLAERGEHAVLASLARAGTPVAILVRRWAQFAHGIDLPHYAVSIVRGRGIDEQALGYLAAHHRPRDVVFVDGWTGKGAIARELLTAVPQCNAALGSDFVAELAVLADTGHCASTFGTRADLLIPSACLNSTVSGLVSRTVLNRDLMAEGDFHGAKYYRTLAASDLSERFLTTIAEQFPAVRPEVDRTWRDVQAGDRALTWSGWSAVESIAQEYGLADLNLVKPGVGETTRVLLRRVPWRVLVRPQARPSLRHVLLLAADRGVDVVDVPGLAFDCVGLIRPGGADR